MKIQSQSPSKWKRWIGRNAAWLGSVILLMSFVLPSSLVLALVGGVPVFIFIDYKGKQCELEVADDGVLRMRNSFVEAVIERQAIKTVRVRGNKLLGREIVISGSCRVITRRGRIYHRPSILIPDALELPADQVKKIIDDWRLV